MQCKVFPVDTDCDRLCTINIQMTDTTNPVISLYMSCDTVFRDSYNANVYNDVLQHIREICHR